MWSSTRPVPRLAIWGPHYYNVMVRETLLKVYKKTVAYCYFDLLGYAGVSEHAEEFSSHFKSALLI